MICLVEDDAIMGESLMDRFGLENLDAVWHRSAAPALEDLARRRFSVVVCDVRLPDLSGEELFVQLQARSNALPPFIFITGFGAIDRAVKLLKLGAADYITKPFDLDDLIARIQALVAAGGHVAVASNIAVPLGVSPSMRRLHDMLPRLAQHSSAVLLTGESGVGKERVATLMHRYAHPEEERPFIAVNCGALAESLLEAELFGYEKGAFTGAGRTKRGVFEQAHGGTLFLDEIGEMPIAMQVRLLRALQERRITRVGGESLLPVDFRLVCATHRELKKLVEAGDFREDLYYRLNVIQLRIPPLRERTEDILWFARQFLDEFSRTPGSRRRVLSRESEKMLLNYPWPGNVRELRHAVERACVLSTQQELRPTDFFDEDVVGLASSAHQLTLNRYLEDAERAYILKALTTHRGQIGVTAQELGISRKNLWEKMKKLGLSAEMGDDPGLR
jgi:DNA-binding NtrC family response regulator